MKAITLLYALLFIYLLVASAFFFYVRFLNKNEGSYYKKNKELLDGLFEQYTMYEILLRIDILSKLFMPIYNQLKLHIKFNRTYNSVVDKTFINDYYLKENNKLYNKEYFLKNLKNLEETYLFLKDEMGFKANEKLESIYTKYKNQELT